jgi:hypothetical protein
MEKRPMMLAAVEAVTKTDPVRAPRGHKSDIAAQAPAGESVHAASPPNSINANANSQTSSGVDESCAGRFGCRLAASPVSPRRAETITFST